MLIVIVLIAAGILSCSTAYASSHRRVRSEPTLTRRPRSKTGHLPEACVALLALGAVALAIHVQLGASF